MKTLKEFKSEIRRLGYRVKTHKSAIFDNTHIHLSVLNPDKSFVAGSGANVYSSDWIEKHRKVFDLLNENRGQVFDTDYDPPIKVLF